MAAGFRASVRTGLDIDIGSTTELLPGYKLATTERTTQLQISISIRPIGIIQKRRTITPVFEIGSAKFDFRESRDTGFVKRGLQDIIEPLRKWLDKRLEWTIRRYTRRRSR